ncbi:MAG: hypothetical protein JNL94_06615, partial [Planctomycetes bacterium]|nr:hypothetical protein [Planctomycetota bacterium]
MRVEYVPLLDVARELYRIPLGQARFQEYLRVLRTDDRSYVRYPPLVSMNPMAKEHVLACIDAYRALDADAVARSTIDASRAFAPSSRSFSLGFGVVDDVQGGWTNRAAVEHDACFAFGVSFKAGWISVVLWASEPPLAATVRDAVALAIARTAHVERHGMPDTLRAKIAQERAVHVIARVALPTLDAQTADRVRSAVEPHLDATDLRTAVECLAGDAAAESLGFTPRGIPRRAALAV